MEIRKKREKSPYRRIFVVVIDSLGIGAMEDAERFGDAYTKDGVRIIADTLGHIDRFFEEEVRPFSLPNLESLGLGNLKRLSQVKHVSAPRGRYCAMNEKSVSKDTMTGHWEMMGIETKKPQVTFGDTGFPKELIEELERRTGRHVVGNKASSGTVILEELGEEEIRNNALIVYTSADSVLQICGNEETMGLDTLYRYCEIARELTMRDEWRVGRVIARPYTGMHRGEFKRTSNRRDYCLKPDGPTVLNVLQDAGLTVRAVGKIGDIFSMEGITDCVHSDSSVQGMEQTTAIAKEEDFSGLVFTNLVDFDALWGHRRNPGGYGEELERFDAKLSGLMDALQEDDLLIITADHGNDPTWSGTDHTREKVPFIAWSPRMEEGGALPETDTFAVIGATILDNFGLAVPENLIGTSLLSKLT